MFRSLQRAAVLRHIRKTDLSGPHMLAFMPALCLAAFWGGGEFLLILCPLCVPVGYALSGGFARALGTAPPGISERGLLDEALHFLETAQHHGQMAGCFQLDVSGLDDISQQFGPASAKEVGSVLQNRIQSVLRDTDFVFQTSGNQFAVLVSPSFRLKLDSLIDLSKRIREAVEEPVSVSATTRYLTAAIGIAPSVALGRNATAESWAQTACQALQEALENGPSATRVWSDKLARRGQARQALRDDLADALNNGQIQAHFQPQISLHSNRVTGMEALARWDHPTQGVIPPATFLRALEDGGHMEQLGLTMLAQSLSALRRWDAAGCHVPHVCINLSAVELRNPELPNQIQWELQRCGLPAHRLSIEILETVIADSTDEMLRKTVADLAEMGCQIALDDFGTGHASITTLQNLPVHRVKIDQSFIRGADRAADKKRMLTAILNLVDTLGLESLAEGVETLAEHSTLGELGCQYAQGFLYSEPKDPSEMETWLQDHSSDLHMADIKHASNTA